MNTKRGHLDRLTADCVPPSTSRSSVLRPAPSSSIAHHFWAGNLQAAIRRSWMTRPSALACRRGSELRKAAALKLSRQLRPEHQCSNLLLSPAVAALPERAEQPHCPIAAQWRTKKQCEVSCNDYSTHESPFESEKLAPTGICEVDSERVDACGRLVAWGVDRNCECRFPARSLRDRPV